MSVSRPSYYFTGKGESLLNLSLMRLVDEQFLETPWYGSRQMARWLRRQGYCVSRKRTRRLMRKMGLHPVYQKPRTTVPHPEHRIYPYLLRDLLIYRPNQVWCADITYIPMRRGFLYLVAIMDWHSRKVLSWRLWRSLKYESVYLNAFETGSEARAGIDWWIEYYNTRRPHSTFDGATPNEVYNGLWKKPLAA